MQGQHVNQDTYMALLCPRVGTSCNDNIQLSLSSSSEAKAGGQASCEALSEADTIGTL